jgi:hypothetical protein
MLWRGVRAAGAAHVTEAATPDLSLVEKALVASLDGTTFQPCLPSSEPACSVPIRWSTLPGPHQLKLAAAFLRAGGDVPGQLRTAAVRVYEHWRRVIAERQIHAESHAALYALEGLVSAGIAENDSEALALAAQAYRRIVEKMDYQRSDVMAQAIRIGCVLRSAGHLQGSRAGDRLAYLASRLARCVAPTGAVSFFESGAGCGCFWNCWSGLFAHQAFRFLANAAHGTAMDPAWITLIV